MPSVQEELEALRQRNLTKKNAESLKDAGPLSTPEAEENALKSEVANKKTYSKEAQAALKKANAVDQTLEFQMKTGAAKKTDLEKQKEAAKHLQSFNQAKLAAHAKSGSGSKEPTAVTTVSNDENDDEDAVDDVPELEELDDEIPNLEATDPSVAAASGMIPPGMDPAALEAAADAAAGEQRINRAERKARRTMEKLGMKKIPGITQCTIKMGGRQGLFTIYKPAVFEKNGSYVVFGEARQGGGGMPPGMGAPPNMQEQQAQAAQKLAAASQDDGAASEAVDEPPKIEELDEEAVDESGVQAKDIELVISQAGCSRAKAVKALKENDGDLVNAIMSLTS